MPLRAIFRRALRDGELHVNPTADLELPSVQGRRDRIASPMEATALIEALAPEDRALWATAFYAGLRRGELQALRWDDVDLAQGYIRVERRFDDKARVMVDPKSAAGRRTVPLIPLLRDFLDEQKLRSQRTEGLVFGLGGQRPFTPSNVARRAATAWKMMNRTRADRGSRPLQSISLHECRHTYASLMIAAGVNPKALCTSMGHASINTTFDRYGHLMPGNEEGAAARLEAYLRTAHEQARLGDSHLGMPEMLPLAELANRLR